MEHCRALDEALIAPVRALDVLCDAAMRAELERAGYHQHARGEWRRKKHATT